MSNSSSSSSISSNNKRAHHVTRHTKEYTTFYGDPHRQDKCKKLTAEAYEKIRVMCEDDQDMVLSIILSLITKHTHEMANEAVLAYDADNTIGVDEEIPKTFDNVVDALNEISQVILMEKINFKRLIIKVRRNNESTR